MSEQHSLKAGQFLPKKVDDNCTENKAGKYCK